MKTIMSRKIKDTPENKKFSKKSINSKTCEVPDTSIFFSFQYITSDDHYNLNYLKKIKSGKEKAIYFDLFSSLSSFSQSSWKELQLKRKQSGGYETIEYGEMKESIANRLPKEKNISDDTKLIVFRFGNNYRMVGYKSNRCKAAMHVLGFDFDYSLYNHGS